MMKKVMVVVVSILALLFLAVYFSDEHQDFLRFDRQREAWHLRCDVYIGTPDAKLDEDGRACLKEFQAMMAYAKRQGWQ